MNTFTCRLCIAEINYEITYRHNNLITIIDECLPIKIPVPIINDPLPHTLCKKCVEILVEFSKFRKLASDNNTKLWGKIQDSTRLQGNMYETDYIETAEVEPYEHKYNVPSDVVREDSSSALINGTLNKFEASETMIKMDDDHEIIKIEDMKGSEIMETPNNVMKINEIPTTQHSTQNINFNITVRQTPINCIPQTSNVLLQTICNPQVAPLTVHKCDSKTPPLLIYSTPQTSNVFLQSTNVMNNVIPQSIDNSQMIPLTLYKYDNGIKTTPQMRIISAPQTSNIVFQTTNKVTVTGALHNSVIKTSPQVCIIPTPQTTNVTNNVILQTTTAHSIKCNTDDQMEAKRKELEAKRKELEAKLAEVSCRKPVKSPRKKKEKLTPKYIERGSKLFKAEPLPEITATSFCDQCDETFPSSFACGMHSIVHNDGKKYTCQYCPYENTSEQQFAKHLPEHDRMWKYTCTACEKVFLTTHEAKIHKHMEHKEYKVVKMKSCDQCDRTFVGTQRLKYHKQVSHGEKRVFQHVCEVCGKVFPSAHNLQKHINIHNGVRPFICEHCGKAFPVKQALKVHMVVHTGERRYVCEFCGKKFSQRSPLVIHERKHTGVKPYKCHLCKAAFICKPELMRHKCKRVLNGDDT